MASDQAELVMPTPQFPFEIWLKIVSFLEVVERWKLYSVNRILFKICMDEKYRSVQLQTPKDVIKNLDLISTAGIACRVRHLDYWPNALAGLNTTYIPKFQWEPKDTRIQNHTSRCRNGNSDSSNSSTPPEPQDVDHVQEVVSLMTRLTNVQGFNLSSTRNLELTAFLEAIPTISAGWMAFGDNLRKLTLDVTLEGFWRVLTPDLFLPKLEDLTLKFSKAYLNTNSDHILQILMAPFVNNHHSTLRSLTLSTQRHIDISSFLLTLNHLTKLTRLSYSCVLADERQLDALHHVLSTHTSTLQVLILRFMNLNRSSLRDDSPSFSIWFSPNSLPISLPQLESLDFRMESLPDLPDLVEFLQQYESTLTSLILGYKKFTVEEMENITEVFRESAMLRTLNIGVCCLRPRLLDTLAMNLPRLETLSLLMDSISSEDTSDIMDAAAAGSVAALGPESDNFEQAMIGRSYPNWNLKAFRGITATAPAGGLGTIERALRRAAPRLEVFQLRLGRT